MILCHCGKPAKTSRTEMIRMRLDRKVWWWPFKRQLFARTWYFCSPQCLRWWMREEMPKWR